MHRSGCYGRCPVYEVEVTSEGKVTYRGERFVRLSGEHHGSTRFDELARLSRAISEGDFFSLKQSDLEACTVLATDNATVYLLVVEGERSHRLSYYYGCETAAGKVVDRISKIVDEVAVTSRWVTDGAL